MRQVIIRPEDWTGETVREALARGVVVKVPISPFGRLLLDLIAVRPREFPDERIAAAAFARLAAGAHQPADVLRAWNGARWPVVASALKEEASHLGLHPTDALRRYVTAALVVAKIPPEMPVVDLLDRLRSGITEEVTKDLLGPGWERLRKIQTVGLDQVDSLLAASEDARLHELRMTLDQLAELAGFGDGERDALMLRLAGYTPAQIAERMARSRGAVDQLYSHAVEKLKLAAGVRPVS